MVQFKTAISSLFTYALILGAFAPQSTFAVSATSRLCRSLLVADDAPPRLDQFDVRLPALPMARQCPGACLVHAVISHLQNRLGVRLSTEYTDALRLRRRIDDVYANRWTDNLEFPLNLAKGQGLRDTFAMLKEMGAIVPADRVRIPPELWRDLMTEVSQRSFRRPDGTLLSPIEFLDRQAAIAFANRDIFQLMKSDEPPEVRAQLDATLDRWLSGIDPTFDRFAYADQVLNKMDVLEVERGPGVEAKIRELIDRRSNVMMTYEVPAPGGTAGSAAPRLPVLGHAVTIEGYRLDWAGQLRWLLIRDWDNTGGDEPKYESMHINVFRQRAWSIGYLRRI